MQVRHDDAQACRRGVHREVETRFDNRGRNQRHDCNKGFHQHRAVANKAGIGFVGQQLRRGAGGDQRVEAGDRAAGDGDKQEREQRAFPQRTGTINVLGHCRHFQVRVEDNDPQRQADDYADFQEGGQIIARRQNQPYRQQRGNERVANQGKGDSGIFKGQRRAPVRVVGNHAAEPDRGHQQHDTDNRHFTDAAWAQEAHVDPHKQGDRHRRADGKHAPRAFRQRFHHDERQHREDDDHNQEAAEQGDRARNRPHLLFNHLAQRGAVTPRGDKQHHEVLYRARQHHAGQQPQGARQIAHLRGQYRADQRAGAGNGGKVVAKQHVAVGWHIVQAIVINDRRRGARRVKLHHLLRDVQAVITVGDEVHGNRRDDDPQGTDVLTAAQGDD